MSNFRIPELPALAQLQRSPIVLAAAGLLTSFLVARSVNKSLSKSAQNNFTTDKTWDWKKELVVITGGASGIGAAIVDQLVENGVKVIILDLVAPKKLPRNCVFYTFDCTSTESIKSTAAKIRAEHGDPTVLINNAGVGFPKPILERSEAMIRKTFDVNIISHFLMVQEYVPAMIAKNHGHIVTIASAASFGPQLALVDYAASKAGALAFHEGLGQELKWFHQAEKVRTTVVHPGFVRTALTADARTNKDFEKAAIGPEEVAKVVVKQLLSGYGGQLFVPAEMSPISLNRGLPTWLQIRGWDSLSRTMVSLNKLSAEAGTKKV